MLYLILISTLTLSVVTSTRLYGSSSDNESSSFMAAILSAFTEWMVIEEDEPGSGTFGTKKHATVSKS